MTHIAIDLDDVILDFTGGVRAAVEHEFGIEVPGFSKWEISDILDPIIGRSWWSWLEDREWLWANFPAIPGAIGSIERLRADGHYLEIVTSKPRWAEHNVWKWLGKWRPAVHRVTIVSKDDNKGEITNATILIDDKPRNLTDFLGDGSSDRHAILFTRPHNASSRVATREPEVTRATGWLEVLEIINGR